MLGFTKDVYMGQFQFCGRIMNKLVGKRTHVLPRSPGHGSLFCFSLKFIRSLLNLQNDFYCGIPMLVCVATD